MDFIDKVHQSVLEISLPEKHGHIQRTDENTPQTSNQNNRGRQKRDKFEQFLQISYRTDMKSTKKTIFQQKNTKVIPFVIKSVLASYCKRFVTLQYEKAST